MARGRSPAAEVAAAPVEIVADQGPAGLEVLGVINAARADLKTAVVREEKDSAVRDLEGRVRTIGGMTSAVTALRSSRDKWW